MVAIFTHVPIKNQCVCITEANTKLQKVSSRLSALIVPRAFGNEIANGPDGIALVGPNGVLDFISYGKPFVATNGPAAGLTSFDVGVEEPSNTPSTTSIQLIGLGYKSSDFTWTQGQTSSPGFPNTGQTIACPGFSLKQSRPRTGERVNVGEVRKVDP